MRSASIRGRCSAATSAKIVANLPYNIATALLIDWLSIEPWPPWYDMMVLMFQREVAERIVAHENDEAYGRLGVLANWRAETKILFDISPAAFVPQPKVTSSVVRLIPRGSTGALRPPGAGAGRRGGVRPAPQDAAAKPEIIAGRPCATGGSGRISTSTRRAETIPISGFVAMARELANIRSEKNDIA